MAKRGKSRKAGAAKKVKRSRPARKTTAKPSRSAGRKGLLGMMPGLTANDLQRSLNFYTDVLGFAVTERWTGDDGQLRGAMLKCGTVELGLSQDDWAKGRNRKKGEGVRLWFTTRDDIDALGARIKAAGWPLTQEPADQPWGGRSLALDDPDGFHLTVYRE